MRSPRPLPPLVILGLLAACSAGSATPDGTPTVTLTSTASTAAPLAKPVASGASIACGAASCSVPSQVCCIADTPRCVAAPAAPASADPAYLGAVAAACGAAGASYAGFAACDDSSDCRPGTRCCDQFTGSGDAGYAACAESCDVHEVCVDGKPCALAGAACVGGVCAKPLDQRRCGSSLCAKDRPYCCGDGQSAPACSTAAECQKEGMHASECAGPRDCLEGACQRNVMGDTYCTRLVDIANAALVCEKNGDCDDTVCMGQPGQGRCDLEERACTCVSP